jgi:ABC-type transport system substrate-binding protein
VKFLRHSAAGASSCARAFAAVVACACALAACSKVGTESAAGGAAGGNPWTQHGVLRMANLSEPDTLNPEVGNQQVDSDLAMLWGGFFYNWSDANEYVPELVTAVPSQQNGGISKDGLTYTYHLRRGVTWQDGAPFDARDVIFTWHAIMNKKNNIPSTVGFDLITAIDTPDPYTLRVHLKEAWAPFVATFFNQSGTPFPVLPAHLLAKYPNINQVPFNAKPVGTGPFSVERWQRGSKIVFEANPHYWRGAPKLKRIEYDPIPNENTILTLLQSHEIDLEYNGAANNWEQLKNVPGTRAVLTDFNQYGQLALNVTSPLLGDVRVRKALTYALDLKSMIQRISHGVNVHPEHDPLCVRSGQGQATARRGGLEARRRRRARKGRHPSFDYDCGRDRFGQRQRGRRAGAALLEGRRRRGAGQELHHVAVLRELWGRRHLADREVRCGVLLLGRRHRSGRLDAVDVRSIPAQRTGRVPLLRPHARCGGESRARQQRPCRA